MCDAFMDPLFVTNIISVWISDSYRKTHVTQFHKNRTNVKFPLYSPFVSHIFFTCADTLKLYRKGDLETLLSEAVAKNKGS